MEKLLVILIWCKIFVFRFSAYERLELLVLYYLQHAWNFSIFQWENYQILQMNFHSVYVNFKNLVTSPAQSQKWNWKLARGENIHGESNHFFPETKPRPSAELWRLFSPKRILWAAGGETHSQTTNRAANMALAKDTVASICWFMTVLPIAVTYKIFSFYIYILAASFFFCRDCVVL